MDSFNSFAREINNTRQFFGMEPIMPRDTTRCAAYVQMIKESVNDTAFDKMLKTDRELKAFMAELRKMQPGVEQIKAVDKFWNQKIQGVADETNWNTLEYVAKPSETWKKKKGDCEDYAIAKYATLRKLGYNVDDLQVLFVELKNPPTPNDKYHVVLSVNANNENILLDNLTIEPRTTKYVLKSDYTPYFGMNENQIREYNSLNEQLKSASKDISDKKPSSLSEKDQLKEIELGFAASTLKARITNPNKELNQTANEIAADSYVFGELFVPKDKRQKFHTMPHNAEYYALVEFYANRQEQRAKSINDNSDNKNIKDSYKFYNDKFKESQRNIENETREQQIKAHLGQEHLKTCKNKNAHVQSGALNSGGSSWQKVHKGEVNNGIDYQTLKSTGSNGKTVRSSINEQLDDLHKLFAIGAFEAKISSLKSDETFADSLIFKHMFVPEKEQGKFHDLMIKNPDSGQYKQSVQQYAKDQFYKIDNIFAYNAAKNKDNFARLMQENVVFNVDVNTKDQIAQRQLQDVDGYLAMAQNCKKFKQEVAAAMQKQQPKEEKTTYLAFDQ